MTFLMRHSEEQMELREALRSAFPKDAQSGSCPSAKAITSVSIPYLDAFIDEILRLEPPGYINNRAATEDVTVLGHKVPKGIDVFFLVSLMSRPSLLPSLTYSKEHRAKH